MSTKTKDVSQPISRDVDDQRIVGLLLEQVQEHFGNAGVGGGTYQYTIGPIGKVWRFRVTNSWQRWMDAGLDHQFDGLTPADAIQAFLNYVRSRRINVEGLAE